MFKNVLEVFRKVSLTIKSLFTYTIVCTVLSEMEERREGEKEENGTMK